MRNLALCRLVLAWCVLVPLCFGQSENATISGRVTDSSGAVVVGAVARLQSADKGTTQEVTTNGAGIYMLASVPPGVYNLTIQKEGFKREDYVGLIANVQDHLEHNFQLTVGAGSESVTVTAETMNVNTSDASISTVVDRKFVENMPLNGRSFQDLIALAPGVTTAGNFANGGSSGAGAGGEISVNGQRTETNYYAVDGVSANTGISATGSLIFGNGAAPSVTAMGTTQALVPVDALQEFRIQTSTYSAEYGRTPGAQISLQTRSGTNTWHGSAFEYFRNDVLDANNWFNDHMNPIIEKAAERQNDFGGTLGGPVRIPGIYDGVNKTFFFFSYEGLRLRSPQPAFTSQVPDTFLRQNAPNAIRPLLAAFPIQNGPDDPNCLPPGPPAPNATCLAQYTWTYSAPSSLDSYSLRLDQSLGDKFRFFARYSQTPSFYSVRGTQDPAVVQKNNAVVKAGTFGSTIVFSSHLVNEFRLNYTASENSAITSMDEFGGATPLTVNQLFPGAAVGQAYQFSATLAFGSIPGTGLVAFRAPQHQWNITDSVNTTFGSHSLTYGFDYRRLWNRGEANSLLEGLNYFSPSDILSNAAPFVFVMSWGPPKVGLFTNISVFAQDEWKLTDRLHLSFGLRWDVNPPPKIADGPQPYTLDQITNLSTAKLAPAGTPLWNTDYEGFAPRLGIAYQLWSGTNPLVVHGGFGVFYDLGNSSALSGVLGGVGFNSQEIYTNVSFPLAPDQTVLPAPSAASPYNATVTAFDPHLRLPYTLEWNVSIEQGFGKSQALRASYVGAAGRNLLAQKFLDLSASNPNFVLGNGLQLTTNAAASSYNSLQAQYQRRLTNGLQVLASYTWSHAIDNLSSAFNNLNPLLRGNADFDIRHNFNAAITYDVPGSYENKLESALLRHWGIDLRQSARSAFPVDVFSGVSFLPNGQEIFVRPDLVPGVPLYLSDSTAPGGRVVNINAFTAPASGIGNEPRNFIRGFGAWQTNIAIRREFALGDRVKLQFRAESFNIFNHPNFGIIDNFTSAGPSLFGRPFETLNSSLGGLNSLYQTGGPRSCQFTLRLEF